MTQHIFIAIDAENTSLYSSLITKDVLESCYGFVMAFCNSCKPSIYGAQSAKATPGSIEKTDNTFSIEAAYSVRCDFNNIICNNKAEFSDVWLYLLGSELMLENMYSTRLNRWTTIDKERATELKEYYAQEYEKALTETISGLEISQEDCCIECNPQIAYRERTP